MNENSELIGRRKLFLITGNRLANFFYFMLGFSIIRLFPKNQNHAEKGKFKLTPKTEKIWTNFWQISDKDWLKMQDYPQVPDFVARMFCNYFGISMQKISFIPRKLEENGLGGPVLVAKITKNGEETKERILVFMLFAGVFEGFVGKIAVNTRNLEKEGMKITTQINPNSSQTLKVKMTISNNSKNPISHILQVQIDKNELTFILPYSKLQEIFGKNVDGDFYYSLEKIEKNENRN